MTCLTHKQLSQEVMAAIRNAGIKYNIPENYLLAVAVIESGGNPQAVNRSSGAKGLFQFLPSTAAELGLSNPLNAKDSADAAARYTLNNLQVLRKHGIQVDLNHYPFIGYLAHQQGAKGIAEIIKAARNGLDVSFQRRKNMNSNAGVNLSPKQFLHHWSEKFEMKKLEAGLDAMCRARIIP